ncbi:MAG: DVU_1555 family C-GCAxxG-C-C protein [Bifidobacterium adolescentis]
MDDADRMRELKAQGFYCSQIVLIMGMELMGKDNPDLVRAMHALAGGIGFTGETCGALTGGACLAGLYAGKGTPKQEDDPRIFFILEELVKWFKNGYGVEYGGIRCDEILGPGAKNMASRCPIMVMGTLQKVKELLVENGFDLSGLDDV